MEMKTNLPFEYEKFLRRETLEKYLELYLYIGKNRTSPPDFFPKAGRMNERNIWEF